jgi:hypothetical protein
VPVPADDDVVAHGDAERLAALMIACVIRMSARNGVGSPDDGPFVEAKEVIGGYAIFEFRNKEEAVASAVDI